MRSVPVKYTATPDQSGSGNRQQIGNGEASVIVSCLRERRPTFRPARFSERTAFEVITTGQVGSHRLYDHDAQDVTRLAVRLILHTFCEREFRKAGDIRKDEVTLPIPVQHRESSALALLSLIHI